MTKRHGRGFYPPKGKVLHIAGQTREDFADYVEHVSLNGRAFSLPAGAAFYTNLRLDGVHAPACLTKGDNHQDLQYLADKYANMVLQIALYLHFSQLDPVAKGEQDTPIEALAEALKALKRPVYLRIGYEFDAPDHRYEPRAYRDAYRRIVERVEESGVTNVSYVWHSYAMRPTHGDHDPLAWYPGDAYVNWVGISFFQVSSEGWFEGPNRQRLLAVARAKNLPVMICESSPVRFTAKQEQYTHQAYWDYWFKPYFDFIETNSCVRAFSIINCDWDSFSMTRNSNLGNCRISSDPAALRRWRKKMQEKRYIHSDPRLYELLS
ncbi:MAG: glycosyl hydrolase [Planctomycetota bacterium]|jgi:hypothetical protein